MSKLKFFEKLDQVDKGIEDGPNEKFGQLLTEYLFKPVIAKYFFSRIEAANWIPLLKHIGVFDTPRDPGDAEKWIQETIWPASQYLKNVASSDPKLVANTILSIPSTENEWVHAEFVEAVLNMPLKFTEKLILRELDWVAKKESFYSLYPETLGNLIRYLIENEQVKLAREFASQLLEIGEHIHEKGIKGEDDYYRSVDVKARFSSWTYKKVLQQIYPDVVGTDSNDLNGLGILCDLLDKAITLNASESKPPIDYSWIWRGSIGEHEQNLRRSNDIQSLLLKSVRDATIRIAESDATAVVDLIKFLDGQRWILFKRISLYLLSKFPEAALSAVAANLTNRELFDNPAYRNEYARLSASGFNLLKEKQKAYILSWVENGPDNEGFKKWVESSGEGPTEEQIQQQVKMWQRNRLVQFNGSLPINWQQKLESLTRELGEPKYPEFASFSTSWIGVTSPKTADNLRTMKINDLIIFLNTWQTPDGEMEHTVEGLSRTLAEAVTIERCKFSAHAEYFIGVNPMYISGLVDGFSRKSESYDDFCWGSVFKLCQWAVGQSRPDSQLGMEEYGENPGWTWARQQIASFLRGGLKSGKGEIPINYRKAVWTILEDLLDDPDPTIESEVSEVESIDPSSVSINSVRGVAMEALVKYGLWVHRHTKDRHKSFKNIPEVEASLDRHLDIKIDASLAIRSVYGQWFPWLNLLDSNWARKTSEIIFSESMPEQRDAAWMTYVVFCVPYDDIFDVLRGQYINATKRLGAKSRVLIGAADYEEKLSEHLMSYYWRGQIFLEDESIVSFYQNSDEKLKAHAIDFIGYSLKSHSDELAGETAKRLRVLIEWRFEEASTANDYDELAGFAWWFYSGKLDSMWSLTQLQKALATTCKFDHFDHMAERLSQLEHSPKLVLQCLELMVYRLEEENVYFSWNDHARKILETGLSNPDEAIREYANDITHLLGSQGFIEFRSLLNVR